MSDNATETLDLCQQRLEAKLRLVDLRGSVKSVTDLIKGIDRQLDEIAADEQSGQGRLELQK